MSNANDIKFKIEIDGIEKTFTDVNKLNNELSNIEKTSVKSGGGLKTFGSNALSSFKEAAGGVNIFGTNLSSIFKLILGNPIGLFITALTALSGVLMKNEAIANTFNGVIKGGQIIFEKFAGFISNVFIKSIDSISKAFDNPTQILKDFGDFLLNNIINRFKAFGVIIDGVLNLDSTKLLDGFAQLGTGVTDFTNKAKDLANEAVTSIKNIGNEISKSVQQGIDDINKLDAIEEQVRNNSINRAKTEIQIESLIRQAKKDRTITDQQRIDLLIKAGELEKKLANDDLQTAKQKEKLAFDEYQRAVKSGVDADEYHQKYVDAVTQRTNAVKTSNAVIENSELRVGNLKTEMLNKENEAVIKQKEQAQKDSDDNLARIKKEYDDRIILSENYYKQLELNVLNSNKTKEEKDAELQNLEIEKLAAKIQIQKDYNQSSLDVELDLANKKIAINEALTNKKRDIEKKQKDDEVNNNKLKVDSTNKAYSDIGNTLNEASNLAKKGSVEQKNLAVGATIISTYQAAQASYTSLASIPLIGPALGAIAAGVAIASGLARVEAIQNTKAEKGGYILGNSHKFGGVNIEAEGGEVILNKTSMSNPYLRNLASNINEIGGGKSFDIPVSNQQSNIINNNRSAAQRVYVLESDISNVQNKIATIERNSII